MMPKKCDESYANGNISPRAASYKCSSSEDGHLTEVLPTTPGESSPSPKRTQRLLQSEEYVPVRVARERVKVILAEMSDMKTRQLTVVTELEQHYNKMRAQAEEKVNKYVASLQREHQEEMQRLQSVYREKMANVQSNVIKGCVEKMNLEREELEDRIRSQSLQEEKLRSRMESEAARAASERLEMIKQLEDTQQFVQNLQLEVGTLRQQCDGLEKERITFTAVSTKAAELERDVTALKAEREELQARMGQLALDAAEHEKMGLGQAFEKAESEKADLTALLEATRIRANNLETELQEATSNQAKMSQQLQQLEVQGGAKLAETLRLCSAEKDKVEGQLTETRTALEELRNTASDLTKERNSLLERVGTLQKDSSEASVHASKSEGEWRSKYEQAKVVYEGEIDVLHKKLELAELEIAEKSRVDEKARSLEFITSQSQVQLLADQLSHKDAELALVTKKLSAELEAAASQLKDAEEERDNVLQQLAALETNNPMLLELQERTRDVRELEEKKRQLEEARDADAIIAGKRIAELENQLDSVMSEFNTAKQRVDRDVQEQQKKLVAADFERMALQQQLHKAITTLGVHSKEVLALQQELESKEGECDKMGERAQELQRQAEELDRNHQTRILTLERELSEKDRALANAHSRTREEIHANDESLSKAQKEAAALARGLTSEGGGVKTEMIEKLQANEEKVQKLQLNRAMIDIKAEKAHMQRENARTDKVVTAIKTKVGTAKLHTDYDKKITELTEKVNSLTLENKELKVVVKTVQAQCIAAQVAGSEAVATEVAKNVKVVEDKLSKVTEKYEKCKKDYTEVKAQASTLEQENLQLTAQITSLMAKLGELEKVSAEATRYHDEATRLEKECTAAKSLARDCETKWREELVLRKKYFNDIQDLKGKIRVMVRCRPQNRIEKEKKSEIVVQFPDEYTTKVPIKEREFVFDKSYHYDSTQDQVWEDSKYFAQSAVDGYNTCIFAYGQTGSGKTFTMEGNEQFPGLTPRFIKEIFGILGDMSKNYETKVTCYMLELYNDNLWDLFFVDGQGKKKLERPPLDVKLDKDTNCISISNAVVLASSSAEELRGQFLLGCSHRHVRSTGMNDASSRSHLIFTICIETRQKSTGKVSNGKLSLVDLAGSERLDKTGIKDAEGVKEAKSINKSLTALGNVINALVKDPNGHIPYRDNKLTQVMRDSIGGNAKTMMIAAISPASYNVDESINTMVYASRAKEITNDASKNTESKEVARLKEKIAQLKKGVVVNDEEVLTTTAPPAGDDDGDVDPPPDET